jgi:hypothetical protein
MGSTRSEVILSGFWLMSSQSHCHSSWCVRPAHVDDAHPTHAARRKAISNHQVCFHLCVHQVAKAQCGR